jgi:hypothetical protein
LVQVEPLVDVPSLTSGHAYVSVQLLATGLQ